MTPTNPTPQSPDEQPVEIYTEVDPAISAESRPSDQSPVPVAGTWESARTWLDRAAYAEATALWCQMMLGFELAALQYEHGETRGRPSGGNKPKALVFSRPQPFYEMVTERLGISDETARNLIRMAKAAVPRLRKLPDLRDFDPCQHRIGLLPEPQLVSLNAAVFKLTDGLTQIEFMRELGLVKAAHGSGARGGYKPAVKDAPSVTELAEAEAKAARENFVMLSQIVGTKPERFTLLPDEEVKAELAVLEIAATARRKWLSQPMGHRDPSVVTELFRNF